MTSAKRHGVTRMTRIFQHRIFKWFKKPLKPKFVLCIGFIHLSSDWWSQSFFWRSNIQKDKKSKRSTYYVTPWRKGFSINIILKTFLIVLRILLQVPLTPFYIYKHSDVASRRKNILVNLKNWFMSHRDVFSKWWKKFAQFFFLNLIHFKPLITCPAHFSTKCFQDFPKHVTRNEHVTPWRFSENSKKIIKNEFFHHEMPITF